MLRTVWLNGPNDPDLVKHLQTALNAVASRLGWTRLVAVDGVFGEDTAIAVRSFQRARGLKPDGVVGAQTWAELERQGGSDPNIRPAGAAPKLPGIDVEWIHDLEGHKGRPYWPGGSSGVTLDPGFDLGFVEWDLFTQCYTPLLTREQLDACDVARAYRGRNADVFLKSRRASAVAVRSIRISEAVAKDLFPYVLAPYHAAMIKRFPALQSGLPPQVCTAMLSLCFNRGTNNPELEPLEEPIAAGDWARLGNLVRGMQQDHKLEGIRIRRRTEARLILTAC